MSCNIVLPTNWKIMGGSCSSVASFKCVVFYCTLCKENVDVSTRPPTET